MAILRSSVDMMQSLGLPWRSCGQSCTILGPSWGYFAPYSGQCEAILGPSWAILESSWAIWGPILEIIGLILAMFGSILAQLGLQTRTSSILSLFTMCWAEKVLWKWWQVVAYAGICWQVLAYAGRCWEVRRNGVSLCDFVRSLENSTEFDTLV